MVFQTHLSDTGSEIMISRTFSMPAVTMKADT